MSSVAKLEEYGGCLKSEDQTDRLTSSNNDSDDSLASDIGLDHMMCQRLFGRKGRVQSAFSHNKHIKDIRQLFLRYGDSEKEAISAFDFLDNFVLPESIGQRQQSGRFFYPQEGENKNSADGGLNSKVENLMWDDDSSPHSVLQHEKCSKQMKDVGVDAMSQSQQSMNASFETFDQSIPGLDTTDIASNVLNLPPGRCSSYSLSEASLSRSSGNYDIAPNDNTDSAKKNRIDLSISSAMDIVAQGGCDNPETRSIRCNSTGQTEYQDINKMASLMTYSDFVADLKQTPAVSDAPPPKLPPRLPVNTNFNHISSPLPPPCLDNDRFHSPHIQHLKTNNQHYEHHHHHVPYVNQIVPVLSSKLVNSCSLLSDKSISSQLNGNSGTLPPPLPPRQPHITHTQDGRPQVLIRPQRVSQNKTKLEGRPHSFNHYLISKSKSPSSASSQLSPAHLGTYPRSRSHSDTTDLSTRKNSGERFNDDTSTSRIPRRKLKTRRERSQIKQITEKSPTDPITKLSNSGNVSNKQWRDISASTSMQLSDSSCEDNSS